MNAQYEPASGASQRVVRLPLLRWSFSVKLTTVAAAFAAALIAVFGVVEMTATWHQSLQRMQAEQVVEASRVAAVLELTIATIRKQVEAVDRLPWNSGDWLADGQRRDEYGRLLQLMPYVESVRLNDTHGRVLLAVSRLEVDAWFDRPATESTSTSQVANATQVRFRNDNDPVLDLLVAGAGAGTQSGERTVVTIGLRALARELEVTLERRDADVYAVDSNGAVVLHRNPSVLLSRRVQSVPAGPTTWFKRGSLGFGDQETVASVVPMPGVPWRVVVEQPRAPLMAPLWSTLQRTALFVAIGVAAAFAFASLVARRFTRPIRQLHTGAQHLAAGELATRIDIRTGDELEDLAAQFNRMAASLQASVGELEERVADRTRDLALANQHKSEFLAHMSHELRTPLNAILGFADVLREGMAGPMTDEQREYLADIHASGLHLLALINDVLDIARIEAGRLELDAGPLAVADLVQGAAASMRAAALKKHIALELDPGTDAPAQIAADARRLKQILLNLLGNAVKFTPEGGRIVVRTRASGRFVGGLRLDVQDSGIGIDSADLETIWTVFGQANRARRGAAEGSGLGLALVKNLVELHGGEVGVASQPGAGSTFTVDLPAAPTAQTEPLADEPKGDTP